MRRNQMYLDATWIDLEQEIQNRVPIDCKLKRTLRKRTTNHNVLSWSFLLSVYLDIDNLAKVGRRGAYKSMELLRTMSLASV